MCEFALNSTRSAIGMSLAYVVFGHKPTLPLEHAVHAITDAPVQSVTDCVANMESTLQLVQSAVTRLATNMSDYANWHHCKVVFAVDSFAWFSTDHLKLPTHLSWKLASCYVGPFKVIDQINPVAFCLLLPDGWKVHYVFHVSQLKPAIRFVTGSSEDTLSPFQPLMDDSGEFEVEDILDARFVHHSHQLVDEFLIK